MAGEAVMGSRFFVTDALVIGSMRYAEADRIITLYTRDRGRLGAIAKGIRRPKSKTGGRLEPFSLVRANFHAGRGSLYTVTGVETLRTFQGVREELFRMEAGAVLLAGVRRLFPGEEGSAPVFNLLVRAVSQLAETGDAASAAHVVLATRLKLLALLGYAPETGSCAVCGCAGPFCGFSPGLGGVVCEACWAADSNGDTGGAATCFTVSAAAVATLQVLLDKPLAELEDFEIDDRAAAEVEQVLAQTLAYHGH